MGINIVIEDGFASEKIGGIGRYTLDIIKYLKKNKDFVVFVYKKNIVKKIRPAFIRRIFYFFWLNTYFILHLKKHKINIVYFTNYMIPVIRLKNVKYVVSINDVSPILLHNSKSLLYSLYFKIILKLSVRYADYITTISYASKNDILTVIGKYYNIKVLHIGIDTDNFGRNISLAKEKIFLYVGSIEKRKNIIYMIKILEKVIVNTEYKLVICGRLGFCANEIIEYINNSNIRKQICLYTDVKDKELINWYNKSLFFFFPSIYEGFGLPLIEALYFGTQCIAIDNDINREVLGNTGVYICSNNVDKSAQIVEKYINTYELTEEKYDYIRSRAELFSWKYLINEYYKFFKEMV